MSPFGPPPKLVRVVGPPPVVGAPGLGAAPAPGWLDALKAVAPWALGAVVLGAVVASASRPKDCRSWLRSLPRAERAKVRRWLEDNEPPPEWTGRRTEWAFVAMPAGVFSGRPLEVL